MNLPDPLAPIPDPDATRTMLDHLRHGRAEGPLLFEHLYRQALLRFCWGYLENMEEAEDTMQEISYKVLTASDIPDHFRPWVYRIARNHCLNVLRDRARHKEHRAVSADSRLHESRTGHLTRLVRDELKARLVELVATLPESQREVLRLRYVEGLPRAEIAQVLELSESAVKSRLFDGLSTLREHGSLFEER